MSESENGLQGMAEEIFELTMLVSARRSRNRATGPLEFSESEFLTLDIVAKAQPITIGEIQKRVGVVPAQMSRIIRTLEKGGGKGYIRCSINPKDRRRIDVTITPAGKRAHRGYRSARLKTTLDVLSSLSDEDRGHFMRILRLIKQNVARSLTEQ